MDGTLVDSMWVWENAPVEVLRRFDIEPDAAAFSVFREKGYRETAKFLVNRYNLPITSHEAMVMMDEAVMPAYRKDVSLKDGALDYLRLLQEKHVKCCILTANNSELVDIVKERFGLDKYISGFITAAGIGSTKAEPEIFIKVSLLYGAQLSDCVLFEDSSYAIKTAKPLGIKTVGVKDPFGEDQQEYLQDNCDRYVASFRELIAHDIF